MLCVPDGTSFRRFHRPSPLRRAAGGSHGRKPVGHGAPPAQPPQGAAEGPPARVLRLLPPPAGAGVGVIAPSHGLTPVATPCRPSGWAMPPAPSLSPVLLLDRIFSARAHFLTSNIERPTSNVERKASSRSTFDVRSSAFDVRLVAAEGRAGPLGAPPHGRRDNEIRACALPSPEGTAVVCRRLQPPDRGRTPGPVPKGRQKPLGGPGARVSAQSRRDSSGLPAASAAGSGAHPWPSPEGTAVGCRRLQPPDWAAPTGQSRRDGSGLPAASAAGSGAHPWPSPEGTAEAPWPSGPEPVSAVPSGLGWSWRTSPAAEAAGNLLRSLREQDTAVPTILSPHFRDTPPGSLSSPYA